MHEEQWCVDLVSIVKRTVIDIKRLILPGIAVGHGNLAIGVTPVTFAPIAGMIADAGMRDSRCEKICLSL